VDVEYQQYEDEEIEMVEEEMVEIMVEVLFKDEVTIEEEDETMVDTVEDTAEEMDEEVEEVDKNTRCCAMELILATLHNHSTMKNGVLCQLILETGSMKNVKQRDKKRMETMINVESLHQTPMRKDKIISRKNLTLLEIITILVVVVAPQDLDVVHTEDVVAMLTNTDSDLLDAGLLIHIFTKTAEEEKIIKIQTKTHTKNNYISYTKSTLYKLFHISEITTGQRHIIAELKRRYIQSAKTTVNMVSRSEIDNHADTCCFGSNFTPLYFTAQFCDVSPFTDSYEAMQNVEVCSAAMAWDHPENGQTYILEYHQGLWFGGKLSHSLINPNQSRVFGISLCDDPFDPYRKLEIRDPETGMVIPLSMHGKTCYFDSRVPSKFELDNCPHIVMTNNEMWDPANLRLGQNSSEEEEYHRLVSSVTINQETVDCKPNEPQMEFDANETDVILASVSSTLTMESMLTRILSKVCVATYLPQDCDRKFAAIGSKTRHSQVTAEELAKKWRVGIDTARQMLKVTTQLGVRTAVHPLTRRYRTDHFTLRYKRLNETLYSDTMFATVKSLKGNKCAQVFSAKYFIRVHPMESKAECN
jgi:hypothetical protein